MTQLISRRTFFRKSSLSAVAGIAAVAGITASVKLDGNQPTLQTHTANARMGNNGRACCPHYDQDNNSGHRCSSMEICRR